MIVDSAVQSVALILQQLRGFLTLVLARLVRHEAPQNAAALTYTSLLSLVPLMTVTLAVFSAFPVADRMYLLIQDFVFQNFVPTSSELLQQYLSEFSAKASRLTGAGVGFLLLTALMMMGTIDRALNAIWEVKTRRSLSRKFLIYWAVLSLGPVLIGASLLVTSYIISLPILSDAASSGVGRSLLGLTPVAASAIAFTMMYLVIPNRRCSRGQNAHSASTSPSFPPMRRSTGHWPVSRSSWSGCTCRGSWCYLAPR